MASVTGRSKGAVSQALLLVHYKAVPLESSFLDSSAYSILPSIARGLGFSFTNNNI